ncbi:CAP domain-containing protein [Nocardioides sp.]|uniref:CAP domain-containing protein n=1 Tax=Nocardioides sp. TaxID=35761 RepID=UPI002B267CA7|nr:CAP domain-containing protein [Nocardioides sp.]
MPRSPRPAGSLLSPLIVALCAITLLLVPLAPVAVGAGPSQTSGAPARPGPTSAVSGIVADVVDSVVPLPTVNRKSGLVRVLRRMLRLVNVVRSVPHVCGTTLMPAVGPLKTNKRLNKAARKYARKMARNDWFEHDSPNGKDPGDRISAAGYTWSRWGENIGAGYDDVPSVIAAWLASPGHCTVLMSKFRHVGFGYAFHRKSTFGHYWVQDFAHPRRR